MGLYNTEIIVATQMQCTLIMQSMGTYKIKYIFQQTLRKLEYVCACFFNFIALVSDFNLVKSVMFYTFIIYDI